MSYQEILFLSSVADPTAYIRIGTKNKRAFLVFLQRKPYIRARMPAISNKV